MTLECGRIAGVPVRLHWSALIVAVYLAYSLGTTTSVVAALIGVIGFGLSILGHEVGHALIARRFGVATTSIDLWALGGVARLASEAPSPRSEGFIALAGPGASALISVASGVGWLTLPITGLTGEIGRVLLWLAILNVALCIFNMLPGSPLDGGRVLRAIRWARHGDRPRAIRESARSGIFIGVALVIASIGLTVTGRTSVMLVFVGLFIAANARAELTMGQLHDSVSNITVGSVAWLGLAHADEIATAAEIIDQQQRLGEAEAVLVVAQRNVVGIALVDDLYRVPPNERQMTQLGDLMRMIDDLPKASVTTPLTDMLLKIDPSTPVILVKDGDSLVGIVPPTRLRQLLEI